MSLARLVILFAVLYMIPAFAGEQSGSSIELGDSTFYHFGGISGSSQAIGDMEFYRFSNGTSTTRSQIGDMNFCSISQGLALVPGGLRMGFMLPSL